MYQRTGGSHDRRTRRRLVGPLLAVLAVTAAVAACGDDDSASGSTTPPPAATEASPAATAPAPTTAAATTPDPTAGDTAAPATTGTADFDATAYCDASMDINMAANANGDPDADPVAFATALLAPVHAAVGVAPPELADTVASAEKTLQAAIDQQDGSLLEQIDSQKLDAWDAANCGWTKVEVTAEEYHFSGLPDTLEAGDYSFALTNKGQEFHVLVMVKRKPGVTDSWDELMADPAGDSKVVTVLGDGAAPGETMPGGTRLEPGEYLALCPIPMGTTGQTEGTGPPHFMEGMQQVVTVTP